MDVVTRIPAVKVGAERIDATAWVRDDHGTERLYSVTVPVILKQDAPFGAVLDAAIARLDLEEARFVVGMAFFTVGFLRDGSGLIATPPTEDEVRNLAELVWSVVEEASGRR